MKIYILYSYGHDEQQNIKAFMNLISAELLLNKCSDYELYNRCPMWCGSNNESFDDFEARHHNWVDGHPAKQKLPAGIGFRIEKISLIK
jgi:hypothetical protein